MSDGTKITLKESDVTVHKAEGETTGATASFTIERGDVSVTKEVEYSVPAAPVP